MATRTTRYRSHSPTPSPTHHHYNNSSSLIHGYEQHQQSPQAATSLSAAGPPTTTTYLPAMTLDTRSPHELGYGARSDHITLPPFSKNLVLGSAGPGSSSPRYHSSNANGYPLPPARDLKSFSRSKQNQQQPHQHRPTSASIPEGHQPHHYSYDDGGYSEFSQTVPVVDLHSFTPPPLSSYPSNGLQSRSLPPLNPSVYSSPAQSYAPPPQLPPPQQQQQKLDSHHRQRQLSINSIISSPGAEASPSPRFTNLASPPPAHGNGTLKKRKKSFEADDAAERQDGSDREKDSSTTTAGKSVGLGLGLEDPDVRLAAEALGDLRADLNHGAAATSRRLQLSTASVSSTSSSNNNTCLNSPLSPTSSSSVHHHHHQHHQQQQQEQEAPLLDLIQSNPNPVLRAASAAGRLSAAAYSTSKAFSPRWKYAAESVESVAKGPLGLVSKVGKSSGLEGLMRRSLGGGAGTLEGEDIRVDGNGNAGFGGGRRSASGPPANGSKKRKTSSNAGDMEVNGNGNSSVGEVSTLKEVPEEQKALQKQRQQQQQQHEYPNTWQTRLISTSGIGVMSEESLKSLKFCLEWLRWANNHLAKCVETLKAVLEEYQRSQKSLTSSEAASTPSSGTSQTSNSDSPQQQQQQQQQSPASPNNAKASTDRKNFLMGRIEALKAEVLKTLKRVITIVDNYAGSALVGETRAMVKRQLLLLPERLQIALVAHTPESEKAQAQQSVATSKASSPAPSASGITSLDPSAAAQRVIIVAKEGLAMVASVSKGVEFALTSAEEWCEKLGGARRESTTAPTTTTTPNTSSTANATTTTSTQPKTEKIPGKDVDGDAEAQQRKLSVATTLVVLGSEAAAAAALAARSRERVGGEGEKSGEVRVGVDVDGDVTMETIATFSIVCMELASWSVGSICVVLMTLGIFLDPFPFTGTLKVVHVHTQSHACFAFAKLAQDRLDLSVHLSLAMVLEFVIPDSIQNPDLETGWPWPWAR
ncbi:transcription factor Opi1-domain-containing protein [Peziza echinospora]|nr:transcription factor Opi1-domain-containing protein [Peziza echinospora]